MKEKIVATYKRESTLWKNANGFYHAQNWTTMKCTVFDYSDDLASIKELGMKWIDLNGNDVTEREIEKRYGKPYCVTFINQRKTNEKSYWFKTKKEANSFVQSVLKDKILGNFMRTA